VPARSKVTLATLVVAGIELLLAYRLHRGYVETLAARLRSGVLHLDLADIVDATTRTTASRTLSSMDRSALLAQIEVTRVARAESEVARSGARDPAGMEAPSDVVIRAMADLRSGDAPTIRAALAREDIRDPALAVQLLQLLDRDDLAADAMRVLSPMASRILGAITDTLLDDGVRPRARRRAARLLGAVGSERSALALVNGLDARSLEVRYACGRALVEMRARNSALSFEAGAMFARATRELESHTEDARSLEHVFDVVSLTASRDTLKLAYGALQSKDAFLQGVALEYLEIALPVEVRTAMMPRLSSPRSAPASTRPGSRALDDLLRSKDEICLHLDELRRTRDPD
jgi:hypothetical protein